MNTGSTRSLLSTAARIQTPSSLTSGRFPTAHNPAGVPTRSGVSILRLSIWATPPACQVGAVGAQDVGTTSVQGDSRRKSISAQGIGEEVDMPSHETTLSKLITTLSEAHRHARAEMVKDGLTQRERTALRGIAEVLEGLQDMDDDIAEAFALIKYGQTLPYHGKRRRMTKAASIVHLYDDPLEAA